MNLVRPRPPASNAPRWALSPQKEMKIQKPFIVALAILLTSCTRVSVTPTFTPEVGDTPSLTQTLVPSATATPQPSATHTDVLYSSEPYSESLFTKQLSSLVLTPGDIPPLDPNYPQLAEPEVLDITSDLENCGKDCVKVVWKSKKVEGVGEKQVSITLVRMETDLQAAENAAASWNEFSHIELGTIFEEGTLIQVNRDWLPNNSKVGITANEPNVEVMFTASRGPVYMMLVYHFQASRDLVLDFAIVQHFAVLQIKKLEAAGYPK